MFLIPMQFKNFSTLSMQSCLEELIISSSEFISPEVLIKYLDQVFQKAKTVIGPVTTENDNSTADFLKVGFMYFASRNYMSVL